VPTPPQRNRNRLPSSLSDTFINILEASRTSDCIPGSVAGTATQTGGNGIEKRAAGITEFLPRQRGAQSPMISSIATSPLVCYSPARPSWKLRCKRFLKSISTNHECSCSAARDSSQTSNGEIIFVHAEDTEDAGRQRATKIAHIGPRAEYIPTRFKLEPDWWSEHPAADQREWERPGWAEQARMGTQ
jgi:hypothetical protein